MIDVRRRRGRRPGVHDDHRVRPGHPQRQHDHHRPRRRPRPRAALPAARSGGPIVAAGVRLPALPAPRATVGRGAEATAGDLQRLRAGAGLPDRAGRPRDPRRRQHPGRRAVRPHGSGRVRPLLAAPRRRGRGAEGPTGGPRAGPRGTAGRGGPAGRGAPAGRVRPGRGPEAGALPAAGPGTDRRRFGGVPAGGHGPVRADAGAGPAADRGSGAAAVGRRRPGVGSISREDG